MTKFVRPLTEAAAIFLAVALMFLFAMPVRAADPYPEAYYPIRTQHGTHSSNAIASTNTTQAGVDVVRLWCVTACYYAFSATNGITVAKLRASIKAANSTTHFLPANVPINEKIGSGQWLLIISVSTGGAFHFTELSK